MDSAKTFITAVASITIAIVLASFLNEKIKSNKGASTEIDTTAENNN